MASAKSGLVETIRYINDPSNCLYGRFAMMAFPACVVGPIVADSFGPSLWSITSVHGDIGFSRKEFMKSGLYGTGVLFL